MVLACQFTVGFFDNLRGRARFNPQLLVVIFVAFGHRQQKPFVVTAFSLARRLLRVDEDFLKMPDFAQKINLKA
jgi:hypothetical protein